MTECAVDAIKHGKVLKNGRVAAGETVTVECLPGYALDGDPCQGKISV